MSGLSDFWNIIKELFSIPVKWDIYVVGVVIIYILFGVLGFYLISQHIKLVKAEVFSISDYIKCLIYAFILATGFIVIIIILVEFAWETQKQYFLIPMTGDLSAFFLWAFSFLVFFLFVFPIFDFLYMAHSKKNKGLTVFQEFIAEKILHKVNRPLSYILALGVYFVLYIIPLYFLLFIGFPPVIALTTVAAAFPVMIINYFGDIGYMGNLVSNYYNMTTLSRSQFYAYGRTKRLSYELFHDGYKGLFSRINFGLQIFFYVWITYSLFRTSSLPFVEDVPVIQSPSWQWQVFISLLFGIWGYFSRFWGRKIKFRWMDILFAAWLVAVTGLNVMINYVISNSLIFRPIFEKWSFTQPINLSNTFKNGDFLYFVPIGVVEEITIITFINYYLLSKKSNFVRNAKHSKIDLAAVSFDPIPLFNLIRDKDKNLREHAKRELLRMYERIPNRKELDLLDRKYMYPLFDAIGDWNKYSKEVGMKIIAQYLETIPKKIAPKIIEALNGFNYDTKNRIAKLILDVKENNDKIISYLPSSTIYSLISDRDYHLRLIGIHLLDHMLKKSLINYESLPLGMLQARFEDPDLLVQNEILHLFLKYKLPIDEQSIISKMASPNEKIRSTAIMAISNVNEFKDKKFYKRLIPSLLNMLQTATGDLEASILLSLSNIGNFKKNKIPINVFMKGLVDNDKDVRSVSSQAIIKYIKEEKSQKDIKKILSEIFEIFDVSIIDIKKEILKIIKTAWNYNPSKSLALFIQNLKHKDDEIQQICFEGLIAISKQNFEMVLNELLELKEEKTYLRHGIVSQTIAKIFLTNPKIIKYSFNTLNMKNDNAKINLANAYNIVAEQNPSLIDISTIINAISTESNINVKNFFVKILEKIAESDVSLLMPFNNQIIKLLENQESSVRLAVLKLFATLSRYSTTSIPIENIVILFNDKDSFIREQAIKIIANLSSKLSKEQINSVYLKLNELLNDKDWNVKNMALETLEKLGLSTGDKKIINRIIELIDDPEKYTKIKAIEVVSNLIETHTDLIPLKTKIIPLVSHKDADIRRSCTQVFANIPQSLFTEIFPYLVQLMGDKESLVRESAQSALVKMSATVPLKEILPNALKYFGDEIDIEIQRSMALALKRILKYESKTLKNRLIEILKIRCEISQDPILCQVLQDLKES
ncbi:MAG: HEAT repeat domain-containing protein [Promethearchaeota archaeon]